MTPAITTALIVIGLFLNLVVPIALFLLAIEGDTPSATVHCAPAPLLQQQEISNVALSI